MNTSSNSNQVKHLILYTSAPLISLALREFVANKSDICVSANVADAAHLFIAVKKRKPNSLVLIAFICKKELLQTIKETRKFAPDLRIIVMQPTEDLVLTMDLFQSGANACLLPTNSLEELYETINVVAKNADDELHGNDLFLKATKASVVSAEKKLATACLNEKEINILWLMCHEKSTTEVATAVNLSPRTVETIRDKLKAKTGSKTIAGLIMFAVKNGIVDPFSDPPQVPAIT